MGWLGFWQYLEAGIALMVTSITTIRAVFTAHKARKGKQASSKSLASAAAHSKEGTTNTFTGNKKQYRDSLQPSEFILVQKEVELSYTPRTPSIVEAPRSTDTSTI